jgi:hypothetical protein
VLDYRPSAARLAVDRSGGKIAHHMGAEFSPERATAYFSGASRA